MFRVTGEHLVTSEIAPAAPFVCESPEIAFHSTPAFCSPLPFVWGCFPYAPPFSPKPPSADHSAGRSSVPVCTRKASISVVIKVPLAHCTP